MPIPDYQTLMRPLLAVLAQQAEWTTSAAADEVARRLRLVPADLAELLPSGVQTVFNNRVSWAATYMLKAGLISRPRRAALAITERGRGALVEQPARIDNTYLRRFEEFLEFQKPKYSVEAPAHRNTDAELQGAALLVEQHVPREVLEEAAVQLRAAVAAELLETLKTVPPAFFEQLVLDLLVKLGYGGSRQAVQHVGRSGDGGIDGVIDEDRLGLDAVYVQAKRWEGTVGRPVVQSFVGALQGVRAHKGVLITTGAFSRDALEFRERATDRLVFIDGPRLADLMIETGLGVTVQAEYKVYRLDSDYFDPDPLAP